MIQIIKEHADELQKLCQESRVLRLELFGSAATSEYMPDKSDLDFIVTFKPEVQRTWFGKYLNLKESLEKLFKSNVDLISDIPMKNPYFQRAVNETRLCIYDGKKTIYNHKIVKLTIMKHDARKYLWDLQKCIKMLNHITNGKSREDYMHDFVIQGAVMHYYTIFGEIINALTRIDKQTASQITKYREYIGFRNILAHQYGDNVNHDIVWSKIKDELSIHEREVDALLDKLV